jgi:hypothetical protein
MHEMIESVADIALGIADIALTPELDCPESKVETSKVQVTVQEASQIGNTEVSGKHIWDPATESKILEGLNFARLGIGVALLTHILSKCLMGLWTYAHDGGAAQSIPLFWQALGTFNQ